MAQKIEAYNSSEAANRKFKAMPLPQAALNRISQYRDKYDSFLKLHNNTSSKEVWKIYDHIASELFREKLNEVLNQLVTHDLDRFVE
jgi:hypothetical protein